MKRFSWMLPWLKNKYVLAILFFLVWMTFFDRNDFISQYNYRQELGKLLEDKEYYKQQIEEDKRSIHELMSDPGNLEKFAREKYHMKKANEDVFLVIPYGSDKQEQSGSLLKKTEEESDENTGEESMAMAENQQR